MLGHFGIEFPDSRLTMEAEAATKETHWFYSVGDELANRGLEGLTAPNLTTYACAVPHSQVVLDRWDQIRSLIISRQHRGRCAL